MCLAHPSLSHSLLISSHPELKVRQTRDMAPSHSVTHPALTSTLQPSLALQASHKEESEDDSQGGGLNWQMEDTVSHFSVALSAISGVSGWAKHPWLKPHETPDPIIEEVGRTWKQACNGFLQGHLWEPIQGKGSLLANHDGKSCFNSDS